MWRIAPILLLAVSSAAEGADDSARELAELSIEQLMDVRVELVSRKAEKLWDAAAAISIITEEDIRRTGARSLPEALRMVPGMYVAHIDASSWVVSARGFAGQFANKLLVQVDGRTVYTPLFSGVFWDHQDIFLEDVERIEVIRGPGATLWGANAVNGIVNIVTKDAARTKGSFLNIGLGTEDRNFGAFRLGDAIGERAFYRVYLTYALRDKSKPPPGEIANDAWRTERGGFRVDWDPSDYDAVTVQGDAYGSHRGQRHSLVRLIEGTLRDVKVNTVSLNDGFNVLGRWRHFVSGTSDISVQAYLDRVNLNEPHVIERLTTFDFDVQHRFSVGGRHEIVWGTGFRYPKETIDSTFITWIVPSTRTIKRFSAFAQDEISLAGGRGTLMIGSKLERNDYTGWEIQPNVRAAWYPRERYTVWGAISRAVRTPSRAERSERFVHSLLPAEVYDPDAPPGAPPVLLVFKGDSDFVSEAVVACELGARAGLSEGFSLDVATFYCAYARVRTGEPGEPFLELDPLPPHLVVPVSTLNKSDGTTYGAELAADWRIRPWWRTRVSYSHLGIDMHPHEDTKDTGVEAQERDTPHNYVHLHSSMDLPHNVALDLMGSWVDDAPARSAKSYFTLNVRVGWHPTRNVELSLVGQRLVDAPRLEYGGEFLRTVPTYAERGVYTAVSWQF